MKRFILMCAILALITSCKTPQVVPLVLRDSVSVTYKQGASPETYIPHALVLSEHVAEVKPQTCYRAEAHLGTSFPPTTPKQIPQMIRVDTIVVERWHTQQVPAPDKPIPRFYKDCTKGFWMLLIVLIGASALRLTKLIYRHR